MFKCIWDWFNKARSPDDSVLVILHVVSGPFSPEPLSVDTQMYIIPDVEKPLWDALQALERQVHTAPSEELDVIFHHLGNPDSAEGEGKGAWCKYRLEWEEVYCLTATVFNIIISDSVYFRG